MMAASSGASVDVVGWLLGRSGVTTAAALTGIRPNRLLSYVTGQVNPLPSTLSKIKTAYNSVSLAYLDDAGIPSAASSKMYMLSPDAIDSALDRYNQSVEILSASLGVDESVIFESMAKSELSIDDLGRYADMTPEQIAIERGWL